MTDESSHTASGGPGDQHDPPTASTSLQTALRDHTLLATLIVFLVLALKLLVIARGRVPVALAILQSAPVATAILGSFMSAVPLLVFVVTAWSTYRLLHRPRSKRGPIVLLAVALLVGVYVAPWLVVVLGPVTGFLLWLVHPTGGARATRATGTAAKIAGLLIVIAATAYAAWVFLDAVWVPHETISVRGRGHPLVGYVLDSDGSWTTVLVSKQRLVVRLASDSLTGREVCVLASHSHSAFSNESPSLWQLLGDVLPALAHARVPSCG